MLTNVLRNESPSEISLHGRLHVEKPAEHPGATHIHFPTTTETLAQILFPQSLLSVW